MTFRPTSIAIDHSFVSQISLQSTEVHFYYNFYSWSDERLFDNTLKCLLFVRCKEHHNLNSFFAIVMGLSNIAVSRLSQTWEVGSPSSSLCEHSSKSCMHIALEEMQTRRQCIRQHIRNIWCKNTQ